VINPFNFLLFILFTGNTVLGNNVCHQDSLVLIKKSFNLYKSGDFYFSGQPDSIDILFLDSLGIDLVVNLRSSREVEYHTQHQFDEDHLLQSLQIDHVHIPLGGKEGFYPSAVDSLSSVLEGNYSKILIHCRRGGRVTLLWMAYLVNSLGYSIDEAVAIGDDMGYFFPLDDLLGYKISFQKVE